MIFYPINLIKSYKKLVLFSLLILITLILLYFNHIQDEIEDGSETRRILNENKHKLAILVPFRDRFDELVVFVPHLHQFISDQGIKNFHIFVLNQSRRYRFNRGALANIGFLLIENEFNYIAIHDVDLLPINKNLSYSYPLSGPYHLAAPQYHPNYNYDKYFGGILIINSQQFRLVNGMSNRYFGWGLEDDEFYTRCKAAKLPITRPKDLLTDKTNTFLHLHYNRKRDTFRTKQHRDLLRRRDLITGLSDAKYKLNSKHLLTFDTYPCTLFNIELYCDSKQTPWCLHNYTQQATTTTLRLS